MDQGPPSQFPLRQKIILLLTVLTGLLMIAAYYTNLLNYKYLHWLVWGYGFGVPLALMTQDTLIDLDNKDIFKIWLTIALIFVVVYISSRNISTSIPGWSKENIEKGITQSLAKDATFSFKALPLFLICYWILNTILKRKTGRYIINTFKLRKWYNDAAQRKIHTSDIFINIILYVIVIVSAVTKI